MYIHKKNRKMKKLIISAFAAGMFFQQEKTLLVQVQVTLMEPNFC